MTFIITLAMRLPLLLILYLTLIVIQSNACKYDTATCFSHEECCSTCCIGGSCENAFRSCIYK
uniref:Seminal fluid protein HACP033 n=1 Tax=Heliconius melpomene TaxID=34740 RepID=D9HQ83_HELME|nr:seminal fluid protein HACP033 [Heliconius melpomene]